MLIGIIFNVILAAWSVLHNDIYYYTDIGRDFLIFDEIVTKKLVLLGPRADMQGLFHGILWHYLNVPAYILGQGNPVIVGWFWIILTVGFLISIYFVMKRLFDKTSALLATTLASASMVQVSQGFFHGNGAMLVMPLFFFFFVRYLHSKQQKYSLAHLIVVGMLVQFEIALGGPLAILSILATLFLMLKWKKYTHLYSYGVLLVFASSFLIVDLRHDFLQLRSLFTYLQGARDGAVHTPFAISLLDRIRNVGTHGMNIIQPPLHLANSILFFLLLGGIWISFNRRDDNRAIYAAFIYFYVGYYILTLLHGGLLIMFWWLPMSILPIMVFATMHRYYPRGIFSGILFLTLALVTWQNILFIKQLDETRGKSPHSWQLRANNARFALQNAPKEFGYFVYAPDIYGYQDKYALLYTSRLLGKYGVPFEKRTVTYVFSEPPPKNFTGHDTDWWIKEKLKISGKPVEIIKLKGNYEARKYIVSDRDLNEPAEITPTDWLFYR